MRNKMKIGIITIHNICNYGSVLQAYALQKIISDMGYDCKIIDYKYPNNFHLQEMKKCNIIYAKQHITIKERIINKIFQILDHDKFRQAIENKFKYFRDTYLNLTCPYPTYESINECNNFDIYISGSDQIWNPRYCFSDPHYFLSWTNQKKISYASSFGVQQLDEKILNSYKSYLLKYSHLSVRESSGKKILNSIDITNTQLVCDPTLLLTIKDWKKFINPNPIIKNKYILCYILSYTFDPYPYVDKFINFIEKNTRKKIIFIGGKNINRIKLNRNVLNNVGPLDFLNLVYFSDLIITTSFHGTAFAINFNKPVYAIIQKNGNDERITSLLNKVRLNDRLIKVGDPFPSNNDFFKTHNDIELTDFRNQSVKYLKEALQK